MVVLEAMSQRLPVIATSVGCVSDLVRDGETGLVVPLRSAPALAAAMQWMLEHPAARRKLAEAAYPLAAAHTWAGAAERTLAAYRTAVSGHRSGR